MVYCMTKGEVDSVCRELEDAGISCSKHHSGVTDAQKLVEVQLWREGKNLVIVATSITYCSRTSSTMMAWLFLI